MALAQGSAPWPARIAMDPRARHRPNTPRPAAELGAGGDVGMARVLERNIEALLGRRRGEEEQLGWQERLADRVTRFTGSMRFVWLHLLLVGGWVVVNLGWIPAIRPFDRSFVVLAMIASVEAIFLSTFILITQNYMMKQADRRADLNLQISLLAEHEVTRLIRTTAMIAERLGIEEATSDPELDELAQDVRPEEVLETLERRQRELGRDS
jgi:uncharacterized membrane protein